MTSRSSAINKTSSPQQVTFTLPPSLGLKDGTKLGDQLGGSGAQVASAIAYSVAPRVGSGDLRLRENSFLLFASPITLATSTALRRRTRSPSINRRKVRTRGARGHEPARLVRVRLVRPRRHRERSARRHGSRRRNVVALGPRIGRGQLRRARAPSRGHVRNEQSRAASSRRSRSSRRSSTSRATPTQSIARPQPLRARQRTTGSRCGPARACTAATTSTCSTGGRSTTRTRSAAASAHRLRRTADATTIAAHVGQQRLDNPYQFQQIPVVAPFGFGTVDVTKLDRPRTIETLKLTQLVRNGRASRPGRLQGRSSTASCTSSPPASFQRSARPTSIAASRATRGFMLGSQLTYLTGERDTYASLVLRHARGIAAYDPLAVPITFALDRTTSGASETQVALGGNCENEHVRRPRRRVRALLPRRRSPRRDLDAEVRRRHRRRAPAASSSASTSASRSTAATSSAASRSSIPDDERAAHRVGREASASCRTSRRPGAARYKRPQFRLIYVASVRERGRARALSRSRTSSRSATSSTSSASAPSGGSTRARIREALMKRIALEISRRCARARVRRCPRSAASAFPTTASSRALATHVDDWRDEVIYQVLVDRFAERRRRTTTTTCGPAALARYQGGDWQGLERSPRLLQGARRHDAVDLAGREERRDRRRRRRVPRLLGAGPHAD